MRQLRFLRKTNERRTAPVLEKASGSPAPAPAAAPVPETRVLVEKNRSIPEPERRVLAPSSNRNAMFMRKVTPKVAPTSTTTTTTTIIVPKAVNLPHILIVDKLPEPEPDSLELESVLEPIPVSVPESEPVSVPEPESDSIELESVPDSLEPEPDNV